MRVISAADAAKVGTFQEFADLFDGNAGEINDHNGFSLLMYSMMNQENVMDKVKIITFLLDHGSDVNITDKSNRKNALHILLFSLKRPNVEYLMTIVKLLVEHGIDVNAQDKYGAVPIKYLVTQNHLDLHETDEVYKYLLVHGANPYLKDIFEKSPVDYANEYSWRSDFIDVVKEYEADGN